MKKSEVEDLIQSLGLFYKFDDVLNLWIVSVDNHVVYVCPKDVEDFSEEEFKTFFSQQIIFLMKNAKDDFYWIH